MENICQLSTTRGFYIDFQLTHPTLCPSCVPSHRLREVRGPAAVGRSGWIAGRAGRSLMVTERSSQVNARRHLSTSIAFHPALLFEQQFYMQMVGDALFRNAATRQTDFATQDGFSSVFCFCIVIFLPVRILCFACG